MNTTAPNQRRRPRGWALLLVVVVLLVFWLGQRYQRASTDADSRLRLAELDAIAEIQRRGGTLDYSETTLPAVKFRNADDDALTNVVKLEGISALDLRRSRVTNNGLRHLKQLPQPERLEILDLANTSISDEGIEHLQAFPKLRSLDLSGTRITGKGLDFLQDVAGLRTLFLNDVEVDSETIAGLGRLTQLHFLFLRAIQPRAAGNVDERRQRFQQAVQNLSALENLLVLDLQRNQLSEGEILQLRDALPMCSVRN